MRTTALEALEAKSGHLHTVADWRIAGEKAQADPAELTDLDVAIIDHFDGAKAAATARDARTTALAPPVFETKALPAANVDAIDPEAIADAVVALLKRVVDPLKARLTVLEEGLAALERAPNLKFQGVYSDTAEYAPGDCVTRQGALWVCNSMTTGSFNHASWQLAVKKGDAR